LHKWNFAQTLHNRVVMQNNGGFMFRNRWDHLMQN
jgi:hypothetical protein